LLDLTGEPEIVLREAAGAVSGQIDGDFIPDIRPVGVMAHGFGGKRDLSHEAKRLREIAKFENAVKLSLFHGPALQFLQFSGNFRLIHFRGAHGDLGSSMFSQLLIIPLLSPGGQPGSAVEG
jgi:hypothetical protein